MGTCVYTLQNRLQLLFDFILEAVRPLISQKSLGLLLVDTCHLYLERVHSVHIYVAPYITGNHTSSTWALE